MKQCSKGHRFPDSLTDCPVCAKDNELKTVFAASTATVSPVRSQNSPPIAPLPEHTADLSKTVFLGPGGSIPTIQLAGWLVLLNADGIPIDSYKLFNRRMTIGRSGANDIVLTDDAVSAVHCAIEFENGKFVVQDNGSSNKTIVDGNPIDSTPLEETSTLKLGRNHFKIKYL